MRPIGIMSIPRSQTPETDRKFDVLMGAVGHNTGNLLFTNAVWQQLKGHKKRLGYQFMPSEVNASISALVIPAANWLGPHVDFAELAGLIEQLEIPVILIGLGAQDHKFSGRLTIPSGTLRFIRAVSERSHSISVRGTYTKKILAGFGIKNVTVTGCPSLYQILQHDAEAKLRVAWKIDSGPSLLHSTRHFLGDRSFIDTPSVHLDLFRHAYKHRIDLLLQSEREEISMITEAAEKPEIGDKAKALMVDLYGARHWHDLEAYIQHHARVFFGIKPWTRAMTGYGRAVGTRLHATIMALNSGIPAVLVHHDSRTREVGEFARLPSLDARKISLSGNSIQHYVQSADFDSYFAARREHVRLYTTFLADNGLQPNVDAALPVQA